MELETSEDWTYTGTEDHNIPIDLFGSKKHAGVPHGILSFTDASGNIVYKVQRQPPNPSSSSPPKDTKLLLDSNDNTLFSIHRHQNGTWKCYKGSGDENKELVFGVKRSVKTLTRVELEVFISGERLNDDICNLKVIGSPFKRSCSIYKDADLVAQHYGLQRRDFVFLLVSFYNYQGFELKVCNLGSQHTVLMLRTIQLQLRVALVIFDLDSLQCKGLQCGCKLAIVTAITDPHKYVI